LQLVPVRPCARIETMTRPATAKHGVIGKEKVDYLVCVWLIGIEPNRARFPQIG
jgi:hypothetical protein